MMRYLACLWEEFLMSMRQLSWSSTHNLGSGAWQFQHQLWPSFFLGDDLVFGFLLRRMAHKCLIFSKPSISIITLCSISSPLNCFETTLMFSPQQGNIIARFQFWEYQGLIVMIRCAYVIYTFIHMVEHRKVCKGFFMDMNSYITRV